MPDNSSRGSRPSRLLGAPAKVRLSVAAGIGVAVGVAVSLPLTWRVGVLCGWDVTAGLLLLGLLPLILPMDPTETAAHAAREDPSKPVTDLLIVAASLASLAGVALVIVGGKEKGANQGLAVTLAVLSVMISWTLVHSNFTTRYARLYYGGTPGGIDFQSKTEQPKYSDFAYVAFTLGMTYQVSDTNLQTQAIRSTALRHALVSYVFGAVIIASIINLVAGLSN